MVTALSELTIREAEPGDEVAILRAQRKALARLDPARAPPASATWRRRYLQNPRGRRALIAVTPAGEVVAQQAGLPVRMRVGDSTVTWTEIVDSFVDPDFRRGLAKAGPFVRTAQAFFERYAGPGPDQDQVLHGLPTRPAYRVGKELLGFEAVRNLNRLAAAPRAVHAQAAPGTLVEEVADFPAEVEAFFPRAARPFGAIAVRDRAFLTWRFGPAAASGARRRIALARSAARGDLCGYAVASRGRFDGREGLLVEDFLTEPDAREAGSALRAWLARTAVAEGAGELIALLPESCELALDFQREGFRLQPTSYFQMARSTVRGQDMHWLYWNWYYTLADFDRA